MVKRKRVNVKLAKLRVPFRDSSSDSGSSGVSIKISSIKQNNKLLARALNESREKIRELENSIMSLRTENMELRVQVSDLKAQFVHSQHHHSMSETHPSFSGYSELEMQDHLASYLEPLKGICTEALNHTVSLTAEISRAMTYINAPQVTRKRSLSNGGLPPRRSHDRPQNKVKKVSPMVSGHIVHKPDIKIKKLDMRLLLGTAAREGIRVPVTEEASSQSPTPINGFLFEEGEERRESASNGVEREEDTFDREEEEEGGGSEPEEEVQEEEAEASTPPKAQVQKFLSRSCQPRVSLRPFDMSLIEEQEEEDIEEEEEEEMPRRRRVSKTRLYDKRRSETMSKSSVMVDTILEPDDTEANVSSTVECEPLDSILVPKEVTDVFGSSLPDTNTSEVEVLHPPPDSKGAKDKIQNVVEEEEETPKSKTDVSDKLFLEMAEHDPQEGPSWLFEDLFDKNKRKPHTRHSLRRKTASSSCSKKLSFVNYCPDPRELRPYDDGSSSDDLSLDEDEAYEAKKPPPPPSLKAKGKKSLASSSKSKRSLASSSYSKKSMPNKSKRIKMEIKSPEPSSPVVREKTPSPVLISEEDPPKDQCEEGVSDMRLSSDRPRRAAASFVSLKEPSLHTKLRNPNPVKRKKSTGGAKSKKKSG